MDLQRGSEKLRPGQFCALPCSAIVWIVVVDVGVLGRCQIAGGNWQITVPFPLSAMRHPAAKTH
jgi:hypothetical protein